MHSIREMCGADDVTHAVNLLQVTLLIVFLFVLHVFLLTVFCWQAFYSDFTKLDESLVVDQ